MSGSRHRTGARFTLSVTKQEHQLSHLNRFGSLAHNPLILRMACVDLGYLGLGRKTSNSFRFFNTFLLSVNLAPALCRVPVQRKRRPTSRVDSMIVLRARCGGAGSKYVTSRAGCGGPFRGPPPGSGAVYKLYADRTVHLQHRFSRGPNRSYGHPCSIWCE
jgi:hypothetical protein